ncbi:hypothetical protein MNBD_NITROSPINAE01-1406 [hydrothermal vent metagenome]|uniref:Transglycosylase SLT domain-containing protein n=1 Tax=hydrothermal vent metagenome TaxID=652676 RepID=A0A3B1C1X2_9ZZZZ
MSLRITLLLFLLASALFVQANLDEHNNEATPRFTLSTKGQPVPYSLASFAGAGEPNITSKTRMVVLEVLKKRAKSLSDAEMERLADVIIKYSERHGHDPFLVLAVIETESSFRRSVISRKGAVGLMQVRPFVAKAQARELNISEKDAVKLLDPATNVMIGTYYLAKMRKRFGDLSLALEAYNRGPTKLRKSLRKGHKLRKKYTTRVLRSRERLMNMVNAV